MVDLLQDDGWVAAFPVFLVALAWAVVPGLLFLKAAGLSWGTAAAQSPAASLSLLGVLSLLSGFGLPWRPAAVAALLLALPLLWFLAARSARKAAERWFPALPAAPLPDPARNVRDWLPAVLGASAATLLAGRTLGVSMDSPGNPNQAWDGAFHLSATRFVTDTADASPLHLLRMIGHDRAFYPDLVHAHASLTIQATGSATALGFNMATLVWLAVLWPWALVQLALVLFPQDPQSPSAARRWAVPLTAALVGVSVPAFPYLFVERSGFFPNILGMALMPFLLGPLWRLLGSFGPRSRHPDDGTPAARWWLLAAAAAPGVALAHPSSLFTAGLLTLPLALAVLIPWVREAGTGRRRAGRAALLATGLAAFALAWAAASPMFPWKPRLSLGEGAWETATLTYRGISLGWALPLTLWAGLGCLAFLLATRRTRTQGARAARAPGDLFTAGGAAGAFLLASLLYWSVVSWPVNAFTTLLTGMWYNSDRRVASAIVVPLTLLAVWSLTALATWVERRIAAWPPHTRRLPRATAGLALAGALTMVAATATATTTRGVPTTAGNVYRIQPGSQGEPLNTALLNADKLALIAHLSAQRDVGRVMADPFGGGSYIYSLGGTPVLFPMASSRSDIQDPDALLEAVRDMPESPDTCRMLRQAGVTHVAVMGPDSETDLTDQQRAERIWAGLRRPLDVPWATEVFRSGLSAVYRVGDC